MGFFTKPGTELTGLNPPVSRERIAALLEAAEWRVSTDDDGDVFGTWDGNLFYFFLMGAQDEILQIRGRWAGSAPLGAQAELLPFLDEHHRDRLWPKAYTREDPDGTGVYAEVSTDLEHGVADDQLDQLLRCGLFTSLQLFDRLSETFPQWAPRESEG